MSSWTVIPDSAIDFDSPWTEDRTTEFRENMEYLFERALRCGTHATGIRLAFARGSYVFDTPFDQALNTVADLPETTITFSTDAIDGDPKFSAAPKIWLTVEEDGVNGIDWFTNQVQASPYIRDTSITATLFVLGCIGKRNTGTTGDFAGVIHWFAAGPTTSGE